MSDQLLSSEKYILFYSTSWLKFPSIYSIYSSFGLIERKSDCDSHLVLHLVFLNQHTCLPPQHDKLSIKNLYSILFNWIDYSFVNERRKNYSYLRTSPPNVSLTSSRKMRSRSLIFSTAVTGESEKVYILFSNVRYINYANIIFNPNLLSLAMISKIESL